MNVKLNDGVDTDAEQSQCCYDDEHLTRKTHNKTSIETT